MCGVAWIACLCKDIESSICKDDVSRDPFRLVFLFLTLKNTDGCVQQDMLTNKHFILHTIKCMKWHKFGALGVFIISKKHKTN